jgi:hypothetical protein
MPKVPFKPLTYSAFVTLGACIAVSMTQPSGAASAHPAPNLLAQRSAQGDASRRVQIEFGEPILLEQGALVPCELGARLADCVARVTQSAAKAPRKPALSASAASADARAQHTSQRLSAWVCGEWQALWQGRGAGRNCEWR